MRKVRILQLFAICNFQCSALLDNNNRETFLEDINEEYEDIREDHYENLRDRKYHSLADARKRKLVLDWKAYKPVIPNLLGTKSFRDYDLEKLKEFIDWKPFFDVWQLRGKYPHRGFPKLFNDPAVGEQAKKIYDEANKMLSGFIKGKRLKANGVVGFFPANSRGDDILVYDPEGKEKEPIAVFYGLRQQAEKEVPAEPDMCLSDFVAPVESGVTDYIGVFAVSAGFGCSDVVAE